MTTHVLQMLAADEISRASAAVRADARFPADATFVHIVLHEPDKAALIGDTADRAVEVQLVDGPGLGVIEIVVSLTDDAIVSWDVVDGVRPTLLFGEAIQAIFTTKEHPDYIAALARRGITDVDNVQIDPWPSGVFGYAAETDRRIARCISFLRTDPLDNGYARPIEGLIVHFDLGRNEVIEVIDHGVVPMPEHHARYFAADNEPLRNDLKPIHITQPDGPSFTVDGTRIQWQKWSFRITFDPYEGLVLHQLTYADGGRERSILHRASISEMVVPYGDPGEQQGWKNAFDAGEWGLGRMTQPLTLGCDCLGEIHYFDAVLANEKGEPSVIQNAVCLHEEDAGIGWKHVDLFGGTHEVRRSRRLVISFISTVGNYEYGFFWYLYLDGNIQLEVKLTGIVSPMAIEPGTTPEFATVVAPGVAAANHQHLFSARLDFDVDGSVNEVHEVETETLPAGPDNPWKNAFRVKDTRLDSELAAQRDTNAATSRAWKVVNPNVTNALGQPTAYKLTPMMSTPTLLAHPDSSVGKRAGFAQHNLWVTPYRADERRAAGNYPNQHDGGDGLPSWTAADRSLLDTDIVVWYTFGLTHIVRPEDWPVTPVEYTGFLLRPFGFFDRNPALDVPPSPPGHCD